MFRKTVTSSAMIVINAARAQAAGDWHDVSGHHRYYGSSACDGGERIVERRSGPRPRNVNVCGF